MFCKACQTSFRCGHCLVEDSDDTLSVDSDVDLGADETLDDSDDSNPIWRMPAELRGPIPIVEARNAIAAIRASATAYNIHQPNNPTWRRMPHPIDLTIFQLFWINLDWFISTNGGLPLAVYVHGYVYTPVPAISRIRKTVYRLFNSINTPLSGTLSPFRPVPIPVPSHSRNTTSQ